MSEESREIGALKEGLKATWTSGDYGRVARGLQDSARAFLADIGVSSGQHVLDVACGTGQIAIPAARAGARVTGIDIAENWIALAEDEARSEGLDIRFDVGDAEDMPYADGSFDLVVSLLGVMFAPRPERAAAELLRVCRPGGRIVMGNWTAEGVIGDFFRTVGRHVPPPDMPSPLLWGDEAVVRERLGAEVADLRLARRNLHFDYPMPPAEVATHYLEHFGPTRQAAAALDTAGREALRGDLEQLWAANNAATDGTTQVDAEILEVVAVRRET